MAVITRQVASISELGHVYIRYEDTTGLILSLDVRNRRPGSLFRATLTQSGGGLPHEKAKVDRPGQAQDVGVSVPLVAWNHQVGEEVFDGLGRSLGIPLFINLSLECDYTTH